jgi:carboxypeptidase C (cathepsin A)
MGESYGTYRALGVADILDKHETPLRGMILLSNIYSFSEDPNLSAVFLLPNFTAAAFAHHRLSSEQQNDLAKTVAEAQHWAEQSYLSALVQGDRLAPEEKKAIADKLAHFTGIAADVWAKNDLRLSPDQFANEVLGPGKLDFIGHYDTRMVGHNSHAGAGYDVAADPSLDYGVDAAIVPYLRTELGWKSDALYAGPFGGRWPSPSSPRGDWTSVRWDWSGGSEDRSPMLAAVLKDNPGLRMLVGSGYFDLATPFAAAEYEVSQLRLAPDARARIRFVRYEGGHSVNMDTKVRAQLFQDAQALVMATGTSGASHSFPPPGNQHNPDNGVHVSSLHLTVGRSAAQEGNCRLVPAN